MQSQNQISTFTFPVTGADIRTARGITDTPLFAAPDVCKILGIGNTVQALSSLEGEDYCTIRKANVILNDSKFPNRGMSFVSESGLYKLVLRSRKPQAKPFQDWVTRDVLPAIRKDGAYVMGEEKVATGEMGEDEFILAAMQKLQSKVDRLKEEHKKADAVITGHIQITAKT